MKIDFDHLPSPEPSSLVGFSRNRLIRDAENRNEETLPKAMADKNVEFYLFSGGRMLVYKADVTTASFKRDTAEKFAPLMDEAILLGMLDGNPRIAVPCNIDTETLEEPWTSYDGRGALYSGSISEQDTAAVAHASAMLHWHSMNRFCGKCGAKSNSRIGGYRRDCPDCGSQIFPRTDPVVIMLPVQLDRCVLGRSPHFPENWYSTLAGFVEPGETIEDAVRRETYEESGIKIGRVKYHASQPWPFPHSLMIGIHCEAETQEIKMDESELEDCRWFSRDEVQLMIRDEHPDGFRCPPNRAISSALINFWALD